MFPSTSFISENNFLMLHTEAVKRTREDGPLTDHLSRMHASRVSRWRWPRPTPNWRPPCFHNGLHFFFSFSFALKFLLYFRLDAVLAAVLSSVIITKIYRSHRKTYPRSSNSITSSNVFQATYSIRQVHAKWLTLLKRNKNYQVSLLFPGINLLKR